MTKKYNWRIANWMDKDDYSVDEAVEDCKTVLTFNADKSGSPFAEYLQYVSKTGERRSEVLSTKKTEVK